MTDKNGLLFMETSALESTNVEVAFNSVLTGKSHYINSNFQYTVFTRQQQTNVLLCDMNILISLQRFTRKCPAER